MGAVILDGDCVLLVQRGQEPLKGEWSLPGGVVEIGETLEVAVAREVREVRMQLADSESAMRQAAPGYAALTQPPPLSVREVQRKLLDGSGYQKL